MLAVDNYLAPSALHGLGVFTRVRIAKGQMVSRFKAPFDLEFPPAMLAGLNPQERKYLKTYAYLSRFDGVYILTGDNDRFMNHSDTPNVGINPDGTATCLALREIAAGEELVCDYREFDLEWPEKLPHLRAAGAGGAPAAQRAPS
jgi:SET domain-containing protein